MTERIPQSTAKLVVFKAYLSSDHVSEATGKTIAITISKNGGAFGNPAAGATNATEISSGWYKVSLGTGDTDTLGPLAVRGAVATVDDVGVLLEVVAATNGGYTALPAVASGSAGGVIIQGTGTTGLDVTSGVPKANLTQILGTQITETAGLIAGGFKKFFNVATPTGTVNSLPDAVPDASGGLPVTGNRLTAIPTIAAVTTVTTTTNLTTNNDKTGYALSSNGVQAIWDALTSALTTSGSIGKWIVDKLDVVVSTRLAATSYTTPPTAVAIANEVEAQIIDETDSEKVLTAITDKIASVNPDLGGLTLSAIASQVRTELSTELARIDAAISSRSTYAGADTSGTTTLLSRLTNTRAGLLDNLDAAVTSRASQTSVDTIDGIVDAILVDTATLPSDPADESLIIAATDAIMGRLGAPAGASVSADIAAVKSDSAAILVDTGTDLPASIAAISAPSASDVADEVEGRTLDVDVKYVNGVQVTGNGSTGSPWGPA